MTLYKTTLRWFAILLFASQIHAQDFDKKFSISFFTDPTATIKDGPNLGASIDYQMRFFYFKAQAFTFPDLRGITYTEFAATPLGINLFTYQRRFRFYTGLKTGVIFRGGTQNPLFGLEGGIDYTFPRSNIFIGIMGSLDHRTDGRVWENDAPSYNRLSGFGKIGFRF